MRIPEDVKKCVVYFGFEVIEGANRKRKYGGTGFLIVMPSKIQGASFLFLVTAKHVVDKLSGRNVYIRANTKDGKSQELKVLENQKWYFHPTDSAADVALIPVFLPQEFDFLPIPSSMLLAENVRLDSGIGIGDEVFITGLFVHHVGHAKNLPIVRTGNIAMTPDERIPIKDFGMMETYLIEARSIGGLSGSPVFVIEQKEKQRTLFLMGLIHGHWDIPSESLIDDISQDAGARAGVNVGIAIVTPASKILDILTSDEMRKMIEELEAADIAKSSPSSDQNIVRDL